ncbi:MAG: hypothetical protein ISN29_04420 [Gammaproteobacteria bacterium AqS3]|nr:hypothetical protein [Gammaproteobacteria bacterium AqS3]
MAGGLRSEGEKYIAQMHPENAHIEHKKQGLVSFQEQAIPTLFTGFTGLSQNLLLSYSRCIAAFLDFSLSAYSSLPVLS